MKLADILSRADGHGLVSIRPMRPEDMEEVREVGQIAWSDMVMHDIGRKFRYPKRSPKIIEAYLAMEPEGCLVAEQGGKIIGSAFCHVWGKVGWIGPLEVLPDHQGSGVGKALWPASAISEQRDARSLAWKPCHLFPSTFISIFLQGTRHIVRS